MNRVILSGILLLLSFTAYAVSDSEMPVDVSAYTVVIDERSGLSTYIGDARITQGSLLISAEKIQIFSKNQGIIKVIAIGTKNKLAHYQQNQNNRTNFVKATARNITYFIDTQLIRLVGKANLTQGFDSFSGDVLNYDIKKDKLIAKQSEDGSERVRFKIKL